MAGKYDKNIKITVDDKGSLKQKTKDVNKLNKAVDHNTKKSGNLDRNMKGNAKMSSNVSKNFSKQAQGMQGVLVPAYAEVAARVFALTAAFTALSNAADYSIMLKGQARFAQMTGKNMGFIAKSIQSASKGMLDFKDASISAALASTAGLATKQIVRMTKAALDSSAALGRSMTDTMDRLTRGIVKAEPEILDEIGVIIRLDTVYKKYAESVRKSTADLTENEKLHARYTAIMDQLSDKFGGIAQDLPANSFKQLSASVLDTVQKLSVGIVDWFGPFLKWLAESKTTILLLLTIITKSLIGKIFPAFGHMGKSLAALPDKMAKNTARLNKQLSRLNTLADKGTKIQRKAKQQLKDIPNMFRATASKVVPKKGRTSLLQSMFDEDVKNLNSAKNRKKLIAANRRLLAYAKRNLAKNEKAQKTGIVQGGAFKGESREQIAARVANQAALEKLDKNYTAATKAAEKGANKAAESMSKWRTAVLKTNIAYTGLKTSVANAIAAQARLSQAFNRNLQERGIISGTAQNFALLGRLWDNAAGKADQSSRRMKIAFSSIAASSQAAAAVVGIAFKALMGALSVFAIGSFVTSVLLGIDQSMSKARSALDELNSQMDETLSTLNNRDDRISFEGLAGNFAESLKSSEFSANIASEMAIAIESAIGKINSDKLANDFWGKIGNAILDMFGKGLSDKQEAALNKIFSSIEIQGNWDLVDSSGAFKDLKADLIKRSNELDKEIADNGWWVSSAGTDMQEAEKNFIWLANRRIEALEDAVKSRDTLVIKNLLEELEGSSSGAMLFQPLIHRMQDVSEHIKDSKAEIAKNLKGINTEFDKYGKERDDLVNTLVPKSIFEGMRNSQRELVRLFEQPDVLPQVKIDSLQEKGYLDKSTFTDMGSKDVRNDLAGIAEVLEEIQADEGDTTAILKDQMTVRSELIILQAKLGAEYDTYTDQIAEIAKHEKVAKDNKMKWSSDEIQAHRTLIDSEKEKLRLITKGLYARLQSSYIIERDLVIAAMAGEDAEALDRTAIRAATVLLALQQDKNALARGGSALLTEQSFKQQQIMQQELDALVVKKRILEGSATATELSVIVAQNAIDAFEKKMRLAKVTAKDLSIHMHKVAGTAYLLSSRVSDLKKDLKELGTNVIDIVVTDTIEEEFNKVLHSLDDTYTETKNLSKAMDTIKTKFGDAFTMVGSNDKAQSLIKQWKALFTKEGKYLTKKNASIDKELSKLELEQELVGQHETLIELRTELADLEMNVIDASNKRMKEEAALAITLLAYKEAEAEIEKMQYEKYASFFTAAASATTQSLGDILSDKIHGVDAPDDGLTSAERIRVAVSKSLSDWGGNFIAKSASNMVFGNKGLLSGIVGMLPGGDKMAEALFPKTEQQRLQDSLGSMRSILESQLTHMRSGVTRVVDDSKAGRAARVEEGTSLAISGNIEAAAGSFGYQNKEQRAWMLREMQDANKMLAGSHELDEYAVALDRIEHLMSIGVNRQISSDPSFREDMADAKEAEAQRIIDKAAEGNSLLGWLKGFFTKHESPNSIAVWDEQANKKLNTLKDLRESPQSDGRSSKWKPGMTARERHTAQLDGLRQPTNKAWLEARFPKEGNHLGSAKTNAPFSAKNPYPSNSITQTKLDFQKFGRQPMTQGQLFPQQDLQWGKIAEKKTSWWNKGRTATEGTQKWLGKKGLLADDLAKLTKTTEAFKANLTKGWKAIQGWRPFKAFSPEMLKTGPTPAVRQAFERLGPALMKVSVLLEALKPGELADGTLKGANPGYLYPGEQGPKTEAQTSMDTMWQDYGSKLDLLAPTPAEHLLDQNMSMITDSTGMKVRIVEDQTKGIETPDVFGGNSSKGDDLNNTGTIVNSQYSASQIGKNAINTMEDGVTSNLTAEMTNVMAGDKFNTDRMVMSLSNLGRQTAVSGITNMIIGSIFNAALGSAGGSGGSGGSGGTPVNGNANPTMAANGAIFKGGFRAFANGGIVNKPTLGLIGEGKHNEAIVPLPDGKSIPVTGGGSTNNNNFTINVTVDSEGGSKSDVEKTGGGDTKQAEQLGSMMTHAIQQELVKQQRPGGLLSEY